MLSALPKLLRLDLTGNKLTSMEGVTASTSLKWLSVASNDVTSIPALDYPELQVEAYAIIQLMPCFTFSKSNDSEHASTRYITIC